jgi:hypothetical protein
LRVEGDEGLQKLGGWIIGLVHSEDEFEVIIVLFEKRYEIFTEPFIDAGERLENGD